MKTLRHRENFTMEPMKLRLQLASHMLGANRNKNILQILKMAIRISYRAPYKVLNRPQASKGLTEASAS